MNAFKVCLGIEHVLDVQSLLFCVCRMVVANKRPTATFGNENYKAIRGRTCEQAIDEIAGIYELGEAEKAEIGSAMLKYAPTIKPCIPAIQLTEHLINQGATVIVSSRLDKKLHDTLC